MGDGLMGMGSHLILETEFNFRSKIIDEYIFYDGSTTFVQPICGIRSTFEVIICNMQQVIGGIQRNMSWSSPFTWMHLKYRYIYIYMLRYFNNLNVQNYLSVKRRDENSNNQLYIQLLHTSSCVIMGMFTFCIFSFATVYLDTAPLLEKFPYFPTSCTKYMQLFTSSTAPKLRLGSISEVPWDEISSCSSSTIYQMIWFEYPVVKML